MSIHSTSNEGVLGPGAMVTHIYPKHQATGTYINPWHQDKGVSTSGTKLQVCISTSGTKIQVNPPLVPGYMSIILEH